MISDKTSIIGLITHFCSNDLFFISMSFCFSFTPSTQTWRNPRTQDPLRTSLSAWSFMTKWRMEPWCWENWNTSSCLLVNILSLPINRFFFSCISNYADSQYLTFPKFANVPKHSWVTDSFHQIKCLICIFWDFLLCMATCWCNLNILTFSNDAQFAVSWNPKIVKFLILFLK